MKLPMVSADAMPRPIASAPSLGLDCVVLGFNELDFHELSLRVRDTDKASAYYSDVKLNSVQLHGRRYQYIDLFNKAVEAAQGQSKQLSSFAPPNLAVVYLTSFLRRRGLNVESVNRVRQDRGALKDLLAQSPRAVAITTTFYVENDPIVDLVHFIRSHAPDTKIIVGGPYIFRICAFYDQATQEYLLQLLGADVYVTDSQGESSLAALLCALRSGADLSSVPNLVWTDDGVVFSRSERIVERNDLDANAIDWGLLGPRDLGNTVYLRTARSCAFACSFCSYPTVGGEHVVNDVEVVIRQLRQLRELGVENVIFTDDTFNVPLPRFKRLLRRMIEERLGLRWMSFFRCTNADDEAFVLMRESGCGGTFLGIESGDPSVLENLDKHVSLERYRYGIRRLNEEGIPSYASLIVGFPGETSKTIENTIEFIETARPTYYFPNIYYHDVRSPIHQRAAELGIRGSGYSWSHATMDWRDCISAVRNIYERVGASRLVCGYSLSFWGLFYLWTQGFTVKQTSAFLDAARPMVLESFDDRDARGFDELVSIFRPSFTE